MNGLEVNNSSVPIHIANENNENTSRNLKFR